jgi:hypothetical protein
MSKMPFTVEDVVNAYKNLKEKGITPIQKKFYKYEEGKLCRLCAISAVLVDKGVWNTEYVSISTADFHEPLNVERDVAWSFIDGFDNNRINNEKNERWTESHKEAFELGTQCRIAVFGK